MLTQDQVIEAVKAGRGTETIDGRDYSRLCHYFPVEQWSVFGMGLKDGAEAPATKPWTEEAIKDDLKSDVEFGFEKALNRRGISAGTMNAVVKMWMWVLEDRLQHHLNYPQYGLPLLKAVAVKYGFENRIGDDEGDEPKYSMHG